MTFSNKNKVKTINRKIEKYLFLYFNSWGSSYQQSLYLSEPLKEISSNFYVFTIGIDSFGGFDYSQIPLNTGIQSDTFRKSFVDLTEKVLTQIINSINSILVKHEGEKVVLMSHSLGYTSLFATLQFSNLSKEIDRIDRIILLDPAGKGIDKKERLVNTEIYGKFIKKFILFNSQKTDAIVFSEWKKFINNATKPQFTTNEFKTGMYKYIIDCDNNSQLDLSIYAYGVEYWNITNIIQQYVKKYPDLVYILTSTNGLANNNLEYWKEFGIQNIEIVSDAGHFIQIFSQRQTIESILNVLNVAKYNYSTYNTIYNSPLNTLKKTLIS